TDASFVLDYMKYVERFARIFDFPFYYRGEVYDPFEGNTLTDQEFILTFEDYVNSYFDSIERTDNKKVIHFLTDKMKKEIKNGFDPSLKDIELRYNTLEKPLVKVVKSLKWDLMKDAKILYNLEILFLSMNAIENAKYVNNLRYVSRHVKNILQNNKLKNRSKYQLFDKEEGVDSNTIVFESFG
ncbi:CDP-glycerol:glycerophosphate glycerophosphotransferase, partial [Mammaliicoccus fleurettii]|nr:CDP-glycerol:glycerophosphate glycerophosphotransferase [Mammaliicoccus fleurettii]